MRSTFFVVIVWSVVACAPAGQRSIAARTDSTATPIQSSAGAMADSAYATPMDSVRGVIESVGNDPHPQLVVRRADGMTCAVIADSALHLANAAGLEVALWGARTLTGTPTMPGVSCAMRASQFAVRAADGVPAIDGILRSDGESFALELVTGKRRPLRHVPSILRSRLGAHIFWAGPLDAAPVAYGVLRDAP